MKPCTANKVVAILLAHGFVLVRQKGSHQIYRHVDTDVMVPVPHHGKKKVIHIGTFLAIVKQSGIAKGEWTRD